MRFNKRNFASTLLLLLLAGCGQSTTTTTIVPSTPANFTATSYPVVGTYPINSMGNSMAISVNGSTCGSVVGGANIPCATVTICSISDPTQCQTIDSVLIDTGSYGLRLFKSVIAANIAMAPITSGSSALAECVTYGDNTSDWGPVEYAYVQLAGEPKIAVPIQVIDSAYKVPPSLCTSPNSVPDLSPAQAGFNGILGVGVFAQDCGATCVGTANNDTYFTCTGLDCSAGATVALGAQVVNPVSALPTDSNGIVITLPSVAVGGAPSVSGTLVLGIGKNTTIPTTPTITLFTDGYGEFIVNTGTSFNPTSSSWLTGIIDSGSNWLYFNPDTSQTALTACTGNFAGLYCSAGSFGETNTDTARNHSNSVTFSVVNASTASSANNVFSNIAGSLPSGLGSGMFDWGLPFFLGKTVYVGLEQTSSTLGAGPYFAY